MPYLFLSANPWACSCALGYLHRYLDQFEFNVYTRSGVTYTNDPDSVVSTPPPPPGSAGPVPPPARSLSRCATPRRGSAGGPWSA